MADVPELPNGADVRWTGEGAWLVAELPYGHLVDVDEPPPVGANHGPRPTDLLLTAAASCSGISAISLLRKMRQPVHALNVRASGSRQAEWPKAFITITLHFTVTVGSGYRVELVHKAIDLAVRRYCPVSATIERADGASEIRYEVEIVPLSP
jgi:putative redox protein